MYIKLSDYAKKFGVTYRTAWNRYKKGLIEGAYIDETNHVVVPIKYFISNQTKKAALYARVSSNENKDNLDKQLERLTNYSISNGFNIIHSIKEIGSGLNDNRPKLIKLLTSNDYDVIIIENKDRLTRFGFNYIQQLLSIHNKEIIIVSQIDNDKQDLINDFVSIIYSFSARLYGLRRAKNKSNEIKKLLDN